MDRVVLNLGGEGEIAGAINVNSLVANRTPVDDIKSAGVLIVHDILEPWPFADAYADEIFGNCLPAFEEKHRVIILREAFRVLKSGCRVRMHAKMLHPTIWTGSMETAGFTNIMFESYVGIRHAIGRKP